MGAPMSRNNELDPILSKNELHELPSYRYMEAEDPVVVSQNSKDEESKEKRQCAMCLSEFVKDDDCRRLRCMHEFHKHCID